MSATSISKLVITYNPELRQKLSCRKLNPEQQQVLDYIREFFIKNDQIPPASVISQHFGWKSPTSAQRHLEQLARLRRVEINDVGRLRFVREP